MFFSVVPNRTKTTLHKLIVDNVNSRSWIFSDGWSAYQGLSEKFAGHRYCNHSEHFVNYKNPIKLPAVE